MNYKKEKSFSLIGCAINNDKSYEFKTIWQLPDGLTAAKQQPGKLQPYKKAASLSQKRQKSIMKILLDW